MGFSRLSIQQKLFSAILGVGLNLAIIVGLTAYFSARQAIINQSFEAVEAVASTRQSQIEQWMSGLYINATAYAKNASIITATQAFRNAIDTSQDIGINRDERITRLRDTFVGYPELVDAQDLSSPYRSIHDRFHPFLHDTQETWAYSDILLVSPLGDVVYTSAKNPDLFTNLLDGEYQDTALGQAIASLLEDPQPNHFVFVDFTRYPATNQLTAFAVMPVFDKRLFTGVLVFSIPIHAIEAILNLDVGIGESGQTYLVGNDHLLRTAVENPAAGGSAVLNENLILDNEAVNAALAGEAGVGFTENNPGVPVLSAWRPIALGKPVAEDVVWALVVETPVSEVTAPANAIISTTVIGLMIGTAVVGLLSLALARQMGAPIVDLTQAAEAAARGDFSTRVTVQTQDEIGTLTEVFNAMSGQLQDLFYHLEAKVQTRTRDLELAMQVSANATTDLRMGELLPEVVRQTGQAFDLYHVSIFLVYPDKGEAVYTSGTGEAGQRLLAEGLALNTARDESIVTRAIQIQKPVLIKDTAHSAVYQPNKYLPETQAELALPMIVQGRVVGVLDLQARETNRFTEDEQRSLLFLAQQLAIAVEHARLYEEQVQVAEELQRLDGMKSEFLARMSHELRTPLNSIINFNKFVLRGDKGEINAGQQDILEKSVKSAEHLLSLINDLLDISKIEAGMLELFLEPAVDVGELIQEAVALAKIALDEKPVVVELTIGAAIPCVLGDRRRIKQVILNLISNACKFTERGKIVVQIACDAGQRYLRVTIDDTGPGITPDELARLFEPFEQTRVGRARASGTGLGLPIAKRLVKAHRGRMIVKSEPGAGATFGFVLPIQSPVLARQMREALEE